MSIGSVSITGLANVFADLRVSWEQGRASQSLILFDKVRRLRWDIRPHSRRIVRPK